MNRNQGEVVAVVTSFTLNTAQYPSGTRFTNRGATGAVTITLPTLSNVRAWRGYSVDFSGHADQNIAITAAAGKGVGKNNAACASITASTANEKIGAHLRAVWDGTQWLFSALQGTGTLA